MDEILKQHMERLVAEQDSLVAKYLAHFSKTPDQIELCSQYNGEMFRYWVRDKQELEQDTLTEENQTLKAHLSYMRDAAKKVINATSRAEIGSAENNLEHALAVTSGFETQNGEKR